MESVPRETETIAHKRAIRLSEKLKQARSRIKLQNAWWASKTVELGGLGIILLLNFILILPFFGLSSISTKFSGPVIPLLAKMISISGVPFSYSVQLVNIVFFLILPVSFYFFVKFVSGRKFAAYLSTLIASLPVYIFAESRVEFGMLSSESPYIAGLAVIPVALIVLLKFLRSGGIKNLMLGSVAAASVALISPFGIFVFTILSFVTAFSEMLLGEGRIKLMRLLTLLIFGASLCSFWYNPGLFTWMVIGPTGEDVRAMLGQVLPMSFFIVPILACIGYLIFDRKPHLQPLFLALFYSILFIVIVLAGGGLVPSNPGRYIPVLGLSLSFFVGIAILMGYEHLHFTRLSTLLPVRGTKDAFLILVVFALVVITIVSRENILPEEDVLGIWTEVEKGDIWSARDKVNWLNSIPGYLITLVSVGTLYYLNKKDGEVKT